MPQEVFKKLMTELPRIGKIIREYPEGLHDKVFNLLIKALTVGGKIEIPPITNGDTIDDGDSSKSSLPTFTELEVRNIVKTEPEWISLMAYHCSNDGKNRFTKAQVREVYTTAGRNKGNASKNFDQSFKSAWKKCFNESSSNYFTFTDKGKAEVKLILERTKTVAKTPRKKAAKKKANVIKKTAK